MEFLRNGCQAGKIFWYSGLLKYKLQMQLKVIKFLVVWTWSNRYLGNNVKCCSMLPYPCFFNTRVQDFRAYYYHVKYNHQLLEHEVPIASLI
jgi:hypothetical protein